MIDGANESLLEDVQRAAREADCLFDGSQVREALDRMAVEITGDLQRCNPLVLCAMVGGVIPTGMLLPRLNFPLELDYVHATRYRGRTAGGELHWLRHPERSLADRVVLIIDDVLDAGVTLKALVEACRREGPTRVLTAVLVDKEVERPEGLAQADYTGLKAANRYLFGCGMDYKGYWRNADGIYAMGEP